MRDAIEPDHLAELIAEMMPVGLSQIVQLVLARVHAARRDGVEKRLPQMRAAFFDEDDLGKTALAEPITEPSDELEPRGAAPDHDDAMGRCGGCEIQWPGTSRRLQA